MHSVTLFRTWIRFPPSPRVLKSTRERAFLVQEDGAQANCFAFEKSYQPQRCVCFLQRNKRREVGSRTLYIF